MYAISNICMAGLFIQYLFIYLIIYVLIYWYIDLTFCISIIDRLLDINFEIMI